MDDAPNDTYELVDAGDGRRLERFGGLVVDRPAPGAAEARRAGGSWLDALTYRAGRGWAAADGGPAPAGDTAIRLAGVTTLVSLAAGGQVGLFPEHASSAEWLRGAIGRRPVGAADGDQPHVLNLFAYTGLLTLVAAAVGASVTHLDASRPAVQWARRNAEASGLADRPIRWIIDDAITYLRREARRGRQYDGLVLDPPSYGHGGGGHVEAFRLDRDLDELLDAARAVAAPDAFWLLSTHTVGWDEERLARALAEGAGVPPREVEAMRLELRATSGARLRLGAAARFDPRAAEGR